MILQHALLLTQFPLSASLTLCLLNPSLKWCANRVVCNIWSLDIALLVPVLTWASTLLAYIFFIAVTVLGGPDLHPLLLGGALTHLHRYIFAFFLGALSDSSWHLWCVTAHPLLWLVQWVGPCVLHVLSTCKGELGDPPYFLSFYLCLSGTPDVLGRNIY